MTSTTLLAYPNVSEGKDQATIDRIGQAFGDALLDVHSDADHHRSAYTLAGAPGRAGARGGPRGARGRRLHPARRPRGRAPARGRRRRRAHHLPARRGPGRGASPRRSCWPTGSAPSSSCPCSSTACSPAAAPAPSCGAAGPPSSSAGSTPASSGPTSARRDLHPTAGAVLVAARPPLVAFNVELAPPATRRGRQADRGPHPGGRRRGPPGLRAIGLWLAAVRPGPGLHQRRGPPRHAAARRRRGRRPARAGRTARSSSASLPRRRSTDFPTDIPLRGYATIEQTLHRQRPHRVSSTAHMAQTKRKRRTKHRGNAAGTIEARGRTGRPPTPEERKKQERAKRGQARDAQAADVEAAPSRRRCWRPASSSSSC